MAPKKQKGPKMSLNEFLGDSALGSWADEMDSLPSAPATKTDEERARGGDRFGRRDDFMSSRPDRPSGPPREDLPLPTQPPYTAFIGNLAFDMTESELESYFAPQQTISVKIIKDREDKPKGFGYIEFTELEGLKDALAKSGSNLSGRTIRVSVAEPPKERAGFGGGFEDDTKFAGNWRREGPIASQQDSHESSRRRFDGPSPAERAPSGVSDGITDWRANRPPTRLAEPEPPSFKRRGSGVSTPEAHAGVADKEEVWTIGSKFKASATEESGTSKFGSLRGRGDLGPAKDAVSASDEGDWRSAKPKSSIHNGSSPTNSTPPTPQLSRRKLELLPRSSSTSASPSPLSSPRITASPAGISRSNPFGAAKPVDVSSKEKEVTDRIEKERDTVKDRLPHPMSRTNSRQATERFSGTRARTPPVPHAIVTPPIPGSPKPLNSAAATVRPSISFANAASAKKDDTSIKAVGEDMKKSGDHAEDIADQKA
ncbi:hypothetical protein SERLA73DRAFT_181797 [Serpula lacrymans var. lacrymans S7.3]|uniref:RRM domain-containing protein n=2 Tax=Serpula lacrymans var. lacrymans TaxID=341189 RepID=F8PYQ1_SERL3|nr:uncharacterized protein SERLADRAFT_468158 [Serpula lacrymans var. lacrymans S7.9]EGN99014.1 hypothetical protein SERLA73DRAFT_181797 [Serpula lacrymans var. lacrymans S7.3]EGO24594.1 hypothetical protein SERLADRAFT_468158 [Serpula lacrymans var. lacrymans S7.9]